MEHVSMRELRDQCGQVIDRIVAGETLTITRYGNPVAELGPLRNRPLQPDELVTHWRRLPPVDAARLQADVDGAVNGRL